LTGQGSLGGTLADAIALAKESSPIESRTLHYRIVCPPYFSMAGLRSLKFLQHKG